MADVFISYARKDAAKIRFLVNGLLANDLSVWWDVHIKPGTYFEDIINEELENAKCIVVVWSANSVKSAWVKREARYGVESKSLVPVVIDKTKIPKEFKNIEAAGFKKWYGDNTNIEQQNFLTSVKNVVRKNEQKKRFHNSKADYGSSVFLNVPFSQSYKPFLDIIVFTVASLGFRSKCTLEDIDVTTTRYQKLFDIISGCRFGIHDISESQSVNNPRTNIILELGMFLAAQEYEPIYEREKTCLIMDKERYNNQKYVSDLGGFDIVSHHKDPFAVIPIIRNWLMHLLNDKFFPSVSEIQSNYRIFLVHFDNLLLSLELNKNDITFSEYVSIVIDWLREKKGL